MSKKISAQICKFRIYQQIQRVRDNPFRGIFDGHHAILRPALRDFLEDFGNADSRNKRCRGTEFLSGGKMRVACLDAKKSNF